MYALYVLEPDGYWREIMYSRNLTMMLKVLEKLSAEGIVGELIGW